MENSESQLEDIKKLFKMKDVQILWFACLEKYKPIPKVNKEWDAHIRILYKHRKKMFGLNLIDVRQPLSPEEQGRKLPRMEIRSKVEWLSKLVEDMVKNDMFLDKLELVFGSTDLAIQHIVDVANSEAFRKGVMNSNLLANIIKRHKEYIQKWLPSQKKTRKGLGSKELLSRWEALIINGLVCLSLFKAFRSDNRCLTYFKSPPLFFPRLITIPGFDFLACYQSFQADDYRIPEQIKPCFTYHQLVEEVANNIREFKVSCPDLWRDAIRKVESY